VICIEVEYNYLRKAEKANEIFPQTSRRVKTKKQNRNIKEADYSIV
jgi:hypothetical protein